MVDLVITAADIKGTPDATGICAVGATIAAGEVVANDANGAIVLADANGGTGATNVLRKPIGIALNAATAGQPVGYVRPGKALTVSAVMTAGTDYWLSGNPGKIAPRADVAAGMTPVLVGLAKSTTSLDVVLKSTEVQI